TMAPATPKLTAMTMYAMGAAWPYRRTFSAQITATTSTTKISVLKMKEMTCTTRPSSSQAATRKTSAATTVRPKDLLGGSFAFMRPAERHRGRAGTTTPPRPLYRERRPREAGTVVLEGDRVLHAPQPVELFGDPCRRCIDTVQAGTLATRAQPDAG